MATLRKYKPKGYFRGGRVLDDMLIADDAPAEAGGFPSEILGDAPMAGAGFPVESEIRPSGPNPPAADENPLQRALDAQRRAEEMQRSPIAREIDRLPISEFKKSFLKSHPELATDQFRSKAMSFHYQQALKDGVEDDTESMSAAILEGVEREIANAKWQAIENVRMPKVEPEPVPVTDPEPTKKGDAPLFAPPVAAPPPVRRSIPMSAPVSRDAPSYSGRPQSDSKMTLTEEERAIARNSYSAPDMTDAQKEYAYAKQKQKLLRLRASGEYRITTEQSG